MKKKMKQASQASRTAPAKAKAAVKTPAKTSAKSAPKSSPNPLQTMMSKAGDAMGKIQKSRTSMWNDYKTGYDSNQGKMKK